MKSYFIQIFILLSLFNACIFGASEFYIKEKINTLNNKVGIKEDEVCFVIYDQQQDYDNSTIICEKASDSKVKMFKNLGTIIGSSMGTPGWLEYSNYIGYKILDAGKPGLVGSARRAIFCDGPCEAKE